MSNRAARAAKGFAAAGLALSLGACGGYDDDNAAAAEVVAQAYLDAYHAHDAGVVCRIIGPGQLASFAALGGGDCAAGVEQSFRRRDPRLTAGRFTGDDADGRVAVAERPGRTVRLLKLGSQWRVVENWRPEFGS